MSEMDVEALPSSAMTTFISNADMLPGMTHEVFIKQEVVDTLNSSGTESYLNSSDEEKYKLQSEIDLGISTVSHEDFQVTEPESNNQHCYTHQVFVKEENLDRFICSESETYVPDEENIHSESEIDFGITTTEKGKNQKRKKNLTDNNTGNLRKYQIVESGVKSYECDVCDKKFERSSYLKIHKQLHTEEKSFDCEICHKTFSQKRNYSRHRQIHDKKDAGEVIKKKNWSRSQLDEALAQIRLGQSVSSVSKRFNIPRTTLLTKKNGTVSIDATFGPSPILTQETEKSVIDWILLCTSRGFPVTKNQLITSVAQLIKIQKLATPFKNGIPGRHWYNAFMRRHPEINSRVSQNLASSRPQLTEQILRKWFIEVENHLTTMALKDADSSRIFSCDESAFYMRPKGDRALIRKGEKAPFNFVINDEKECLTTLFMVNAVGLMGPPLVVFPYERLPFSICQTCPKGWSIGKTENGWMTGESFFEYLSNVFEPWLGNQKIQRPVVLYVDGHSSFLTMPVVEFCTKKEIQLIALYPNATHLIQPLDVALFSPLKKVWKEEVNTWCLANQRKLRREDFSGLLKVSIEKLNIEETIPNGFKTCGLCPFDPNVIQYKLLQKVKETTTPTPTASEEPKAQVTEDSTTPQSLEKYIDEDLLKSFKACQASGKWDGDITQSGLFNLWLKLVNKSNV